MSTFWSWMFMLGVFLVVIGPGAGWSRKFGDWLADKILDIEVFWLDVRAVRRMRRLEARLRELDEQGFTVVAVEMRVAAERLADAERAAGALEALCRVRSADVN